MHTQIVIHEHIDMILINAFKHTACVCMIVVMYCVSVCVIVALCCVSVYAHA